MPSTTGHAPWISAAAIPSENKSRAAVSAASAARDGRKILNTDHAMTTEPMRFASITVKGAVASGASLGRSKLERRAASPPTGPVP